MRKKTTAKQTEWKSPFSSLSHLVFTSRSDMLDAEQEWGRNFFAGRTRLATPSSKPTTQDPMRELNLPVDFTLKKR